MKHLGDIKLIDGHKVPVTDVIVGGSPCQDLSVAGKQTGLDGERSGLFMEQIRVIKEMRENDIRNGWPDELIRPRFFVWENVPGAMSSPATNRGEDFRVVLEEIARIKDPSAVIPRPAKGRWQSCGCIVGKGYSICWRVLDLQYWGATYFGDDGVPTKLGTPQRRRRIALVADFNTEWGATEVLLEHGGLPGNAEAFRRKRKDVTRSIKEGSAESDPPIMSLENHPNDSRVNIDPEEKVQTLSGRMGTGGNNTPMAMVAYRKTGHPQNNQQPQNYAIAETADTLNQFDNTESRTPTVVIEGNGQRPSHRGNGYLESDQSYTLNTTEVHGVAYGIEPGAARRLSPEGRISEERSPSLRAKMGDNQASVAYELRHADTEYAVRRLTPLECERLQGYPDGWTDIGEWIDSKGKTRKTTDSARYKALGNSIGLPPWKWVLKRISAQYERDATMASLFDGIGGYPFLWEQLNGKGTCLWASEIEDFCIAVTEKRINGKS